MRNINLLKLVASVADWRILQNGEHPYTWIEQRSRAAFSSVAVVHGTKRKERNERRHMKKDEAPLVDLNGVSW